MLMRVCDKLSISFLTLAQGHVRSRTLSKKQICDFRAIVLLVAQNSFYLSETAGNGGAVVFSVELTNTIPELKHPTTVDFDHITTNEGDGYYPRTGIFTAPKAGYYSFSASLISYHSSRFFIMMNGQSVEYLASTGGWTADAATVNLKLAKGDKVWIEGIGEINGFSPNCSYTRRFGYRYKCYHSSFSGFLIKEI